MSMSGRNTSIAPSRLGPVRFPKDPEAKGPGPVITYYLTPEEIAAKYGPPVLREEKKKPRATRQPKLTRAKFLTLIEKHHGDVAAIAVAAGIAEKIVRELAAIWKVELAETPAVEEAQVEASATSEGGKERMGEAQVDKPKSMIKQAMEVLSREQFEDFLRAGKTDAQVTAETGLTLYQVKRLKRIYGLTGDGRKLIAGNQLPPEQKPKPAPAQEEEIVATMDTAFAADLDTKEPWLEAAPIAKTPSASGPQKVLIELGQDVTQLQVQIGNFCTITINRADGQ